MRAAFGSDAGLKEAFLDSRAWDGTISKVILTHVVIASVSGLLMGYNLCAISSILAPVEHSLELCGTECAGLQACSCARKQLAVSACPVGAMVGGLLGGLVADRYGRCLGMMAMDMCCAIGCASMSFARTGAMAVLFFVGRFLVGVAAGAAGAIANTYIAEISPPARRGTLVAVAEVGVCSGCLLAFIAASLFGDARWHWTVGTAGGVALAQLFAVALFLVESPLWLARQAALGRWRMRTPAESLWLSWQGADVSDGIEIAAGANGSSVGVCSGSACTLASAGASKSGRSDHVSGLEVARRAALSLGLDPALLLESKVAGSGDAARLSGVHPLWYHRRKLAVSLGLALAHAATAANVVLYYSRDVLQSTGLTEPLLANLSVGVVKFVGAAAAMAVVEKCGRVSLLTGGALVLCIGHGGLALSRSANLSLGSLLLFIFSWSVSWAGLQWTVVCELLPQSIRGVGIGMATAIYWLLSFVIAQTFESVSELVGQQATFLTFGTLSAAAMAFAWTMVPETRGRPLE